MDASELRFVGLDLHRHDVMVGAVNAQQAVVLSPQRVTLQRFGQWAARHLRPTDQIAIEATTNTWALYDLLEPQVAKVVVAHPQQVRLIASAKVKHDKRDALILAQLLAANLLPEVWVPPPPVRQLRSLIVHRQHLAKQQRMAKNRLRGVLFRFNIPAPPGDVASPDYRAWWQTTSLNQVVQLRVQHDLDTLAHLANQITEVNAALARLSICIPWSEDVPFLLQMPGIGLVSAMTILSAVGDITRFPTPKHLGAMLGWGQAFAVPVKPPMLVLSPSQDGVNCELPSFKWRWFPAELWIIPNPCRRHPSVILRTAAILKFLPAQAGYASVFRLNFGLYRATLNCPHFTRGVPTLYQAQSSRSTRTDCQLWQHPVGHKYVV